MFGSLWKDVIPASMFRGHKGLAAACLAPWLSARRDATHSLALEGRSMSRCQ